MLDNDVPYYFLKIFICPLGCSFIGFIMIVVSPLGPSPPRSDSKRDEMKIHRATPDNAFTLAKGHIDSWHPAYKSPVPDSHLDNFDFERRAQHFRASLIRSNEKTFVFEQNSRIFGILTIGESRDGDVDQINNYR